MLTTIETNIIRGLIHDESYTRKVLPYVEAEYFEATTGRTYFECCKRFFTEYNQCIDAEATKVAIEQLEDISEQDFQHVGAVFDSLFEEYRVSTDWLVDETEKWCKERAVYLALLESISIHDGKGDKTRDFITITPDLKPLLYHLTHMLDMTTC